MGDSENYNYRKDIFLSNILKIYKKEFIYFNK